METRRNSPLIQRLPLALAILCLPALATAQATSAQDTGMHDAVQSRISQVKVFPGSATVERVASVRAGSRSITFHCLPAGLDVQSLQVSSDTPLRVGETTVSSEPRAHSPACADSPLDARIRALEDRKAALDAEHQALAYVTGMFQGLAGAGDKRASVDVRELASASETIRRTGQASLLRQYQIDRQRTDLDRELQPLLTERTRSQGGDDAMVTRVSITLEPPARSTDVRLSYQVSGPGWTPSYRAMLDTGSGRLRIERQALVAQATGEDWSGVKLVLSTGQPRRNTAAATPSSWQLGVLTPMPQAEQMNLARMPSPPAPPAAIALTGSRRQAIAAQPLFEAGVFDGSFATEFALPQSLDVPSNGQRVSMLLDSHELEAKIAVRISPAIEAAGYLIAEVQPPQGVWPAGPLQLYRDGAFVGSGRWSTATGVAADAPQTLWFGRDELLRVSAEPPQDTRTTAGFGGGRSERHLQRAYLIENRHRDRIDIQVLEAAPVSSDAQIRVSTRFSPTPAETAWNRQPGVAMWRQSLAAGQIARFSAEHTVSYPKELMIEGL